jgi:putative addiction module antidote
MATKLKVRKIGNSLGIILSKDEFERLGVKEGDALYVVDAPCIRDGSQKQQGGRFTPSCSRGSPQIRRSA